jgi:hypothetical protein
MKMVMMRHNGGLVCVPICHNCNEPIMDFTKANLCSYMDETEFPIEMDAFHWKCDPGFHPWQNLANIMKADQRLKTKDGRAVEI